MSTYELFMLIPKLLALLNIHVKMIPSKEKAIINKIYNCFIHIGIIYNVS